jgi:hypothetical protein
MEREIARLEQDARDESKQLAQAQRMIPRYERFVTQAAVVAAQNARLGWTPALRVAALESEPGIKFKSVALRAGKDPQARLLLIRGFSEGTAPRVVADQYMQRLQAGLGREYELLKPCIFLQLKDESAPAAGGPAIPRASFTIETKIKLRAESQEADGAN